MDFPKRRVKRAIIQSFVDADLQATFRAAAAAHGVTLRDAVEFGLRAFIDEAARQRAETPPPAPRRRRA